MSEGHDAALADVDPTAGVSLGDCMDDRPCNVAETGLLHGLRIGVVGHPGRESAYRRVVEGLGGELCYADASSHFGRIPGLVSRSDGVLFITGFGSHKAMERTQAAASYYGRPVIRVRQSGLEAVERAIREQLLLAIRAGVAA